MSASLQSTLIDPEYRNWVKAGLGLKCTKDGIEHFVDAQVQTFHQKLLTDICQVKGLPTGSVCYICTTQNVLPCPTRGVCTIRRGVCNYHDNHDPSKMNRPCPMGICDEIFNRITKSHRFRSPSWLNTDARHWCRSSWEVAKCYMPPDGYRAVRATVDTDVTGLLSVIINLKDFQNKMAENLSLPRNVFCQARIIRNDILHSSTFQLSEAMLNSYIDLMIYLLQDPVRLVTDTKAQDAIAKLKQIKTGSLTVTAEDERKIRVEALRAIDEKKKEAIQDIQDEGSEQMVQIQNTVKTDLQAIQTEGSKQAAQLVEQKQEATEVIKKEGSEQITQIQNRAKTDLQAIQTEGSKQAAQLVEQKQEATEVIKKEGSEQITQIQNRAKTDLQAIQTEGSKQAAQLVEQKQEATEVIKKEGSEQITQIQNRAKTDLQAIQTEGSKQAAQLVEQKQEATEVIKKEGSEQITQIQNTAKTELQAIQTERNKQEEQIVEQKKETTEVIKKEGSEQMVQIQNTAKTELQAIQREADTAITRLVSLEKVSEQTTMEERTVLQRELINLYMENYLKTPVSPLAPDVDVEISKLYVNPCMRQVDPHQNKNDPCMNQEKPNIKSYKDIFYKDSRQCKKIYITGDAGMGKTTLCQRMISTWCTAHTKQEPPDHLSGDEQVMLKFPFLFYISLRNAGAESSIEEMIRTQLLQDQENLLSTLLHKESANCLIILDGLDEWTPPKHHLPKSPVINAGLPIRNIMNKSTIVATSRPWKLEVLRLTTSEIDQHLELVGLDDASSWELIENVIAILDTKQQLREFIQLLNDKNLKHFRTIPIILKQLFCLWHDGKPLGESQCTIYSGMINLLFELAEKCQAHPQNKRRKKRKGVKNMLPKCFDDATKCLEFGQLISSLGRLAFETLFSQKQESSLVFESSQAELHGMSKTEIDFCLKIGIVTQSKIIKGCTSQMKRLSFLHKTFQEFLAAVFVSMSCDPSHKVVDTLCQICNSVDKVFEMSKVFVFISGMNPEIAYKLSEHIWKVASSITHKYRQCIENKWYPKTACDVVGDYPSTYNYSKRIEIENDYLQSTVSNIFQLMIDCNNEGLQNGIRSPVVKLEDIFIEVGKDGFDPKLLRCNIKSVHLIIMFHEMQSELREILKQISSLQKLTIITNKSSSSADTIFSLLGKSKETLFTLQLCPINILDMSKLPAEDFSNMMPTVNNLKRLCFCNIRLNHNQLDSLMAHLTQAVGLIQLYLFDLVCTDCKKDCRCSLDLTTHQQLEDLRLDLQGRTEVNTSQLRHCTLYKLKGTVPLLECLLKGAPNLQTLHIINIENVESNHCRPIDTEEIVTLAICLLTLENVRTISLHRIDFGETELKLSTRMKNLENIYLYNVQMPFITLCRFVDSIPHTERLVTVAIHDLQIKPQKKAEEAIKHIKSCARFEVLTSSEVGLNMKLGNMNIKFRTK